MEFYMKPVYKRSYGYYHLGQIKLEFVVDSL